MNLIDYKKRYSPESVPSPGWEAIDEALKKIYGSQEPQHIAAVPHYALGRENPLDGVSIYKALHEGEEYFHLVTYGFSSLYYDEESVGGEFSKWGFELTFRVKPNEANDSPPHWAVSLLQNIAKYVFKSKNWFEVGHYMPAKGPLKLESDTLLHGVAFALDKELGEIDTPHGGVQFLQLFGVTNSEIENINGSAQEVIALLSRHEKTNPMLITDLTRGEI